MAINEIFKFDKYFWVTRIIPIIILLIPFYIFQYNYLGNLVFSNLKILENYSTLFHSIVIVASLYFVSIINRGFGKDIIENFYFNKNNKLPTTQILMGVKKVISNQTLINLKNKIKTDFDISLNIRGHEMFLRINDAVDQIRNKVGYKHKILNQYNIEYGFFRNLTGGCIFYFLGAFILIVFAYPSNSTLFYSGISFLAIGLIYMVFSWRILDNHGTKYAKQLFSLYIGGTRR